ncbi:SbcD-like subunit of palindrome specific endonucl ease [Vibrio phage D260]
MMLADELNKQEADMMVIGGDLLDVPNPSTEELELMFDFLAKLNKTCWIFSGNHEMINKKTSVLSRFASEITRCNPLCLVVGSVRGAAFDIISYEELHTKWAEPTSKLCFTHVRGELPEHMKTEPEVDMSKFDVYDKVVTGDLHDTKMSQTTKAGTPVVYPGSPLSTSFHREIPQETNGYFIVDTETLEHEWHDLSHLPHLIRKKVSSPDEMVEDPFNRVIYEIEGDIETLGQLKESDLLDKKLNTKVSKEAKLNLTDLEIEEELDLYLKDVEGLDDKQRTRCITRFSDEVKNKAV